MNKGVSESVAHNQRRSPWVELKTYTFHPTIFKTMLGRSSRDAKTGDLVTVYDRKGQVFGSGLYNPTARVPLRVYRHGEAAFGEEDFLGLMRSAIALRRQTLGLDAVTGAYRAIHSDGDGLSGLIVDKLGDTLSVQVHSYGVYQRLPQWLPFLKRELAAQSALVEVDEKIAELEGIRVDASLSDDLRFAKFEEHGKAKATDHHGSHDRRKHRRVKGKAGKAVGIGREAGIVER